LTIIEAKTKKSPKFLVKSLFNKFFFWLNFSIKEVTASLLKLMTQLLKLKALKIFYSYLYTFLPFLITLKTINNIGISLFLIDRH